MHTMTLIKEHEGTEEWMCYACGRQLLVSWTPAFEKIILLEGNPSIKHTGFRDNKRLHQTFLTGDGRTPVEDRWLRPWITWMNESGFENLWEGDFR